MSYKVAKSASVLAIVLFLILFSMTRLTHTQSTSINSCTNGAINSACTLCPNGATTTPNTLCEQAAPKPTVQTTVTTTISSNPGQLQVSIFPHPGVVVGLNQPVNFIAAASGGGSLAPDQYPYLYSWGSFQSGLNVPSNGCFQGYSPSNDNCTLSASRAGNYTISVCAQDVASGSQVCNSAFLLVMAPTTTTIGTCPNGAINSACTLCPNGATTTPNNPCEQAAPTTTINSTTCSNGGTNFPDCTLNSTTKLCYNGATNYPNCNGGFAADCFNSATNWPVCTLNSTTQMCVNGATNYPNCNNLCLNGTLKPACLRSTTSTVPVSTCTNGAINSACTLCPNGATTTPNNLCEHAAPQPTTTIGTDIINATNLTNAQIAALASTYANSTSSCSSNILNTISCSLNTVIHRIFGGKGQPGMQLICLAKVNPGQPANCIAIVVVPPGTAGNENPTGTVTFTTSDASGTFSPAAPCTLSADTCNVQYTDTQPGSPTITATYSGDSNYDSASRTQQIQVTNPGASKCTTLVPTESSGTGGISTDTGGRIDQHYWFAYPNPTSVVDYTMQYEPQTQSPAGDTSVAYLVQGLTNDGCWYQVGLTYNWAFAPGSTTKFIPEIGVQIDVFYNQLEQINENWGLFSGQVSNGHPLPGGQVNPGDIIELKISTPPPGTQPGSQQDVVTMSVRDLTDGAYFEREYEALGATTFDGVNSGEFTGVMTEIYNNTDPPVAITYHNQLSSNPSDFYLGISSYCGYNYGVGSCTNPTDNLKTMDNITPAPVGPSSILSAAGYGEAILPNGDLETGLYEPIMNLKIDSNPVYANESDVLHSSILPNQTWDTYTLDTGGAGTGVLSGKGGSGPLTYDICPQLYEGGPTGTPLYPGLCPQPGAYTITAASSNPASSVTGISVTGGPLNIATNSQTLTVLGTGTSNSIPDCSSSAGSTLQKNPVTGVYQCICPDNSIAIPGQPCTNVTVTIPDCSTSPGSVPQFNQVSSMWQCICTVDGTVAVPNQPCSNVNAAFSCPNGATNPMPLTGGGQGPFCTMCPSGSIVSGPTEFCTPNPACFNGAIDAACSICPGGLHGSPYVSCSTGQCINGADNPTACDTCPDNSATNPTYGVSCVSTTCTNGAAAPGCTQCPDGHLTNPSTLCTAPACSNGAINPSVDGSVNPDGYPPCTLCPTGTLLLNPGETCSSTSTTTTTIGTCTNGALDSSYPDCTVCPDGTEVPDASTPCVSTSTTTINSCTNGATNPPDCTSCPDGSEVPDEFTQCSQSTTTIGTCSNGATDPPDCTTCPAGYSLDDFGTCVVGLGGGNGGNGGDLGCDVCDTDFWSNFFYCISSCDYS